MGGVQGSFNTTGHLVLLRKLQELQSSKLWTTQKSPWRSTAFAWPASPFSRASVPTFSGVMLTSTAPRPIQGKPRCKPSTYEPTSVQRCSRGRRPGKCPQFLRLLARPKHIPDRLHISHALQRLPYPSDLFVTKAVTQLIIELSELFWLCKPSMSRDSSYTKRNISNTLGKPSGLVVQAGGTSRKHSMGSRAVRGRATEGSDDPISHAGPALGHQSSGAA